MKMIDFKTKLEIKEYHFDGHKEYVIVNISYGKDNSITTMIDIDNEECHNLLMKDIDRVSDHINLQQMIIDYKIASEGLVSGDFNYHCTTYDLFFNEEEVNRNIEFTIMYKDKYFDKVSVSTFYASKEFMLLEQNLKAIVTLLPQIFEQTGEAND